MRFPVGKPVPIEYVKLRNLLSCAEETRVARNNANVSIGVYQLVCRRVIDEDS